MELGMTPEEAATKKFFYGKGCDRCNNTGYKGRQGIYELLVMNDTLREMIVSEASLDDFRNACRKFGMRTLREVGMEYIHNGLTSIEEVCGRRCWTICDRSRGQLSEETRQQEDRATRASDSAMIDTSFVRPPNTDHWNEERRPCRPTSTRRWTTRARGQGLDRRLDPGRGAATDPPEGLLRHEDLREGEEDGTRGKAQEGGPAEEEVVHDRPDLDQAVVHLHAPALDACRTPGCRSSAA